MSNALTPFQFEGSDVRVLDIEGSPWFVASDVAKVLGYARPADALRAQ